MNVGRWWSMLLVVAAIFAGGGYSLQRETTSALESERALLRHENRRLLQLRQENEKLCAAQVTEAELTRLRSDRAALVRLRGEIEQMRAKADEKARQQQGATAGR